MIIPQIFQLFSFEATKIQVFHLYLSVQIMTQKPVVYPFSVSLKH